MKNFFSKLAKLVDIKSILTIMLAYCFCWGFINEKITPEQFTSITTMCFTFFFSYQSNKKGENTHD